jgi:predicted enzyme involved in methoxymalonyl-ACP biosynthesis
MEAVCTSEMSVKFNVTTQRYISEDSELRTPNSIHAAVHMSDKRRVSLLCSHFMISNHIQFIKIGTVVS